jgi:hypothetical protein
VGFRGSGDIADLQVPFLAQIYGDRATSENAFNELNNKWRWASFTTRDLKHCQIMARLIALVCDWWSLFALLSDPNHHREAITSRPLLSHGLARRTRLASQTRLTVTSCGGGRWHLVCPLWRITKLFQDVRQSAEQLMIEERWLRILAEALCTYLHGRQLGQTPWLPPPWAAPKG